MLFQVEKIGYNFFVCTKVSIPKNTLQYQIRLAFPIVRLFAKKSRNFLKILSESLGLRRNSLNVVTIPLKFGKLLEIPTLSMS